MPSVPSTRVCETVSAIIQHARPLRHLAEDAAGRGRESGEDDIARLSMQRGFIEGTGNVAPLQMWPPIGRSRPSPA